MSSNSDVSSLWLSPRSDAEARLQRLIDKVERPVEVFFRADDVGVPSAAFTRLAEIFRARRAPLCLAAVPSWLTRPRARLLLDATGPDRALWCWHQHGWRHMSHVRRGKKQEFGPERSRQALRRDLESGRKRLETVLGENFLPVFTPPWNRCDAKTLELLSELGYHAISRSMNSRPPTRDGLPDFQVNVDLHTRGEADPVTGWQRLWQEFEKALAGERLGIMIHHRRMNDAAFEFLELLLEAVGRDPRLTAVHFGHLTAGGRGKGGARA